MKIRKENNSLIMIIGDRNITIIAIDFDGTITEKGAYPDIGTINHEVVYAIKNAQKMGAKIILWTNREDNNTRHPGCLTQVVNACGEQGIIFDAINENIPEIGECFDLGTRKISADYYIDDKSPGSIEWFLDTYGVSQQSCYITLSSNVDSTLEGSLLDGDIGFIIKTNDETSPNSHNSISITITDNSLTTPYDVIYKKSISVGDDVTFVLERYVVCVTVDESMLSSNVIRVCFYMATKV